MQEMDVQLHLFLTLALNVLVKLMSQLFYTQGKNPQYPLSRWAPELISIFGGQINFLQLLGFEHWIAQLLV